MNEEPFQLLEEDESLDEALPIRWAGCPALSVLLIGLEVCLAARC